MNKYLLLQAPTIIGVQSANTLCVSDKVCGGCD